MAWSPYKEETLHIFRSLSLFKNTEKNQHQVIFEKGLEAHLSAYAMHPGSTKMYKTLKEHYWWNGMKKEIASFVSRCLTCQQVKAEHQKPAGKIQLLPIPVWK